MVSSTSNEGSSPSENGKQAGSEERPKRIPGMIVRYGAMNWVGEFTPKPSSPVCHGDMVVIQTERGIELGQQLGGRSRGHNGPTDAFGGREHRVEPRLKIHSRSIRGSQRRRNTR